MTLPRVSLPLLIIFLLAAFASCSREKVLWSGVHHFGGNRWEPGEKVVFQPDTDYFDTIQPAVGMISMRYGRGCPVSRFPVAVEIESLATGDTRTDTVYLNLIPGELRNGDRSKMGIFESEDSIRLSPSPSMGWIISLTSLADTVITSTYSLTFQIITDK